MKQGDIKDLATFLGFKELTEFAATYCEDWVRSHGWPVDGETPDSIIADAEERRTASAVAIRARAKELDAEQERREAAASSLVAIVVAAREWSAARTDVLRVKGLNVTPAQYNRLANAEAALQAAVNAVDP